ncbi:MAG: class I SAM-dependent methyltransferase [Fibrobacteria bacterium]
MDLRESGGDLQQRHPWERARARFFGDFLAARKAFSSPCRVLDIGAGDGYFAAQLASRLPPQSQIVCFDPNYSQDHIRRLSADAPSSITFTADRPPGKFDLLLLLDVIEHISDDLAILGDWVDAALNAGGRALVSVPAFMSLFTAHDLALGHHRRYSLSQLSEVLSGCGLRIEARGGVFHSLILPRLLVKAKEMLNGFRARPRPEAVAAQAETEVGRWSGKPWVTAAVDTALKIDNGFTLMLAAVGLPLPGLSVWALGRKS